MKHKYHKITSNLTIFYIISLLFFVWGFITILNDLLIPILKIRLQLNYEQALLVQFCFFFTYFVMSMPMALVLNKYHYKKSLIFGLVLIFSGALFFIPASFFLLYTLFLFALFVTASGVTMLQVSANPAMILLGDIETSSSRITMAQGLNSLGYVIAPFLVGGLVTAGNIYFVYLSVGILSLLMALFLSKINFLNFQSHQKGSELSNSLQETTNYNIFKNCTFMLGVFSIFCYVGAEVGVGSYIILFLGLSNIASMSIHEASHYLIVYWGGALIGRLLGSYLLMKIKSSYALVFNALINIGLLLVGVLSSGYLAMWAILIMGLFNSIMFPVIFSLSINLLPGNTLKKKGSGLLVLGIVGGAIIPETQAMLADQFGLQLSFFILVVPYLVIALFGAAVTHTIRGI